MNQSTGIKATAIATIALFVAIVALALAWVAYDRSEGSSREAAESGLNQTSVSEEERERNSEPGDTTMEATTVPQSQP